MLDLTPAERQSSTWIKVTQHICEVIEHLRVQWEGAQGEEKSELIRGRILALKSVLQSGKEKPEQAPPLAGEL